MRLASAGALAIALCAATPARAQTREDFQIWTAAFVTGQLLPDTPSPSLWLDVQPRRGDAGTVLIVRPGVGAILAPWISVWAGYAWVPVFTDATGGVAHEHRIWEQVILQFRTDFGLSFQSRTRLEQRFSDQGGDVASRLRQFVRFEWQPDPAFPLGIVVTDEIFFGFYDTDWPTQTGFDQNRLYAALAVHTLDELLRIEAGYMLVYLERSPLDAIQHALSVNAFFVFRNGR